MINKRLNLFWGSSYDRNLDALLFMWPDILEKYPNAQLHICYGWDLFDRVNSTNPERVQWKKSVQQMMGQENIFHYGRVGKEELKAVREKCGIWAYPTWFPEINCITALDAQKDGLVPVTMNDFALKETVGSGIKIDGDIKDITVQDTYLEELLSLMGDKDRWEEESKKAKKFAKKFTWDRMAKEWVKTIEDPISTPLVSVVTVTMREGWWAIMARNLSQQTYDNFEWVIVDDYKEDRSEIAKKYAEAYGLNIKYIRGDKALGTYKRKHGLVRANNIGWKAAKGELLVYLQDFILIPENGVESLVDLYRHRPNALLAPVDQYFFPKEPNKKNKEDWWDGSLDVVGKFSWRNVRVKFEGIRETDNPYDFEMNYAGIPRSIVERMNGWYEFFDDGMGFDNSEFSQRALELDYKVIIDDTNIATCIDIGHHGLPLNTEGWEKFEVGGYPAIREEKLDK